MALVSRKASRASNAARRKVIAARRERALRAVDVANDTSVSDATEKSGARRARLRAERTLPPAPKKPAASDARIWNALLVGGAAVAVGLLGREIVDMMQDRARPTMMQNDIYSALGSVALLAIVFVFANNRWRLGREKT